MIKLLNLIKESLNEPIEKNVKWWLNNYNILGIINGFLAQYSQNMRTNYVGNITIILFDRNLTKQIEGLLKNPLYLSGYVPKKNENDEYMDHDFIIYMDMVLSYNNIVDRLSSVKDQVLIIQIKCEKLSNGHIQSSVNKSI